MKQKHRLLSVLLLYMLVNLISIGEKRASTTVSAALPFSQHDETIHIVFAANRNGGADIYMIDLDGSNSTCLTNNQETVTNSSPRWDPNSRRIVFASDRVYTPEGRNWEIYTIDLDGSNLTRITHHLGNDMFPKWSPDGNQITFASYREGMDGIYTIDLNSMDEFRISGDMAAGGPLWSPDGTRIAFTIYAGNSGDSDVGMVNSDGTQLNNLTNYPGMDMLSNWSPDGYQILFISERDGNREIYRLDLASSSLARLTNSEADEYSPTWSPDGSHIAFERGGDIYIMNADGSDQIAVVKEFNTIGEIRWLPDATTLIFQAFSHRKITPVIDLYRIDTTCTQLPKGCSGKSIVRIPNTETYDFLGFDILSSPLG